MFRTLLCTLFALSLSFAVAVTVCFGLMGDRHGRDADGRGDDVQTSHIILDLGTHKGGAPFVIEEHLVVSLSRFQDPYIEVVNSTDKQFPYLFGSDAKPIHGLGLILYKKGERVEWHGWVDRRVFRDEDRRLLKPGETIIHHLGLDEYALTPGRYRLEIYYGRTNAGSGYETKLEKYAEIEVKP